MFLNIFIFEEYTNDEITFDHEENRQLLFNTNTYKKSSEEDKLLISDYLELTDSVAEYFYRYAKVDRFTGDSDKFLIIKITFPEHESYENWLINPLYNTQYFLYLNRRVWNEIFGVSSEVKTYLTKVAIECNSFIEAQQIMLTMQV